MSAPHSIALEVATKSGTRTLPVTELPCIIGSGDDASVRLPHPSVRASHAMIRNSKGILVMTSIDHDAKLSLGDAETARIELADGLIVRIGSVPVRIRLKEERARGLPPAEPVSTPAAVATPPTSNRTSNPGVAQPHPSKSTQIAGWVLIALGTADIAQWAMTSPRLGWTNHLLGDNVLTRYGWGIMIAVGVMLLRKAKAERQSTAANSELEPGEEVLLTKRSLRGVLTITTLRVRFIEADLDADRKTMRDIPDGARTEIALADIQSVRSVRQNEVARTKLAGLIKTNWGVSIATRDGRTINLPTPDGDEAAAMVERTRRMS